MSQLDTLLQRARTPGAFVEHGRFSLARDKAIEKLREFSLRNPRQYVLELIQAAVFSGATYIAVDVSPEEVLVAWVGGRPFRERELGSVFDYLFVDRGDMESRHLMQLAVGLNAIVQRRPEVLRVESGDGTPEGTVRVDIDASGRGIVGVPGDPLAGTYVLAEFGTDWLARFRGDVGTPEERLIEENCRFSPVPILLNGRAPFGYKASRRIAMPGCPLARQFDDGQRYGVVAVPPTARDLSQGFHLVIGGVRITTLPLHELGLLPAGLLGPEPEGLAGVIVDDRLRKTADHSDVVREARFAEMLHAVQPEATALIRQAFRRDYEPPALPRIAGAAGVVADLPEEMEQLGPRPAVTVEILSAMPREAPLFRVRPDDARALEGAADPLRLPFPVLVLGDEVVGALEEALPDRAVHLLSTPADVDFVRRALERRQRQREVGVRFTCEAVPSLSGRLSLALQVAGHAPLWADPADGDVAVALAVGQRTDWCGYAPLGLPGVRAVLTLGRRPDAEGRAAILGELDAWIVDHAWRLLPESGAPDEAARCLARGVLAAHAWPHLVRDGERVRLAVALPDAWGAAGARLRDLPLVDTSAGPLTLDDLLALQGTDRVVEVASGEELLRLEGLEERLGFGHLAHPDVTGEPVWGIGLVAGGWQPWSPQAGPDPRSEALIWVWPVARAALDDVAYEAVDPGIPWIGAARRRGAEDAPAGGAPVDWAGGQAALLSLVRERLHRDRVDDLAGGRVSPARVRACLRLAALHLARHLGTLEGERLLWMPARRSWCSLNDVESMPDAAVLPRHGAAVDEPHTLLLGLDELEVLRAAGHDLPLRFDDPPEVWSSLADPRASGWLVRREVRAPGLRGWLGLRCPYDGTSGVFLQAAGSRVPLPRLDDEVPCHGMLRLLGGGGEPSDAQRELLALVRRELYQALVGFLDGEPTAEEAVAARHYAMDFAAAHHAARGVLDGTALDLARRVVVMGPGGVPWGAADRWLDTPPGGRPALPPELAPVRRRRHPHVDREALAVPSPSGGQPDVAARAELERRLVAAAAGALDDVPLVVVMATPDAGDPPVQREKHVTLLGLAINGGHPVARRALRGAGPAREVVLLEMARLAHAWCAERGLPMDLLATQRLLVAQRME